MRTTLILAAGLGLAALSGAAQAQVLASADNSNITPLTNNLNSFPWPLDGGSLTTLTFKTTKPNEVVELSFSGYCGYTQVNGASPAGATSLGVVADYFAVDGGIANSGPALTMCDYQSPGGLYNGAEAGSEVISRISFIVPNAGSHRFQVLVSSYTNGSAYNTYPTLNLTHASVSH